MGATAVPAPASAPQIDLFTLHADRQRVGEASEAFANMLGRTAGDLCGCRLLEVVHADDRQAVERLMATLRDGESLTSECRFVQSTGGVVYAQWVAQPLAAGAGWRVAATDTADLLKLLADRVDLRTRLDLAVGQAIVAMWDLEIASGRFSWEPQAAEILGVGVDAVPDTADALVQTVYAEDREALAGALERLLQDGMTEVGIRVGQDAALRYLSLRGRVLDAGRADGPRRAVGLLLDVTTEKALEEQLLRMSVSDGLTGIRNRRGFDQTLRSEWRRCTRAGEPVALLMIDIDHFKPFNDRFGHLVGDQALIAITRGLGRATADDGGVLARYGGEEFALVLPGTDAAGASRIADRLLVAARDVTVRQAPDWAFSVSIGVAAWSPGQERVKGAELLARADRALYAAKGAGRDRVGLDDSGRPVAAA